VGPGELYKFEILAPGGFRSLKSDPFAFESEVPPRTASIVTDLSSYEWRDHSWLECRSRRKTLDYPMSIYEVHLGSWQTRNSSENGWMNYREIAPLLVDYCRRMGFTHIELMPVTEHPYTGSWGYQTVGYFAATSRYGSPQDFMYFVDLFHQNGIGVIADWVPAHFPRDAHGLAKFDGTALYEHADPRQGEHPEWGTLIFNYGRNEVRNFLVANALFWCDQFHIDGLRVDAVASMLYLDYSRVEGQWVPNKYGGKENLHAIALLRQVNERVHEHHPGVLMIAEESTAWPGVSQSVSKGGLGFDLKWNMGWMNDTLRYMRNHPIHRKYHHDQLTFSMVYSHSERFMLPFSHDEVVHGKGSLIDQMSGDVWQKFANLRLLYTYMWGHPGKKLLFMGNEFAQWIEWNCERSLAWDLLKEPAHQGVQRLVGDLNRLLQHHPPMYEQDFVPEGFQWIDCHDRAHSTLAWIRRARDKSEFLVVACNFTPQPQLARRIGVPQAGSYTELMNSDREVYGGSGMGNPTPILASDTESDGFDHSIVVTLPPLAALILQCESIAKE
jgi:1,4-alpha-glucan branching enzyme